LRGCAWSHPKGQIRNTPSIAESPTKKNISKKEERSS
jgi:hypothetical protein